MVLALLAAASTVFAYKFPAGVAHNYDFTASFQGFIPVLGGHEGKVDVEMAIAVEGLAPSSSDAFRASTEVKSFKMRFNDAALPLNVDNIKEYFPKTTISAQPSGKVTHTDAPDKRLPVRLPGLDVKRFPEISFLPIELPDSSIEVGREWTFSRPFSGNPIEYRCKVASLEGDRATIEVTLRQTYTVLESETLEVVDSESEAVRKVETLLTGGGTVIFDGSIGAACEVRLSGRAVSQVLDLKTKEKSERTLTSELRVKLRQPKS
jgi:hypothetical protein